MPEAEILKILKTGSMWSERGGSIRWLSHLVGPVKVAHSIRLLTVAVYTDDYLIVQITGAVG